MTRRLLVLAAVAAAIGVPAAASQSGPPYGDPAGDGASAGDITGVTVLDDKTSGQVIFRVSGSNLSTAENLLTFLYIDTDANPLTGSVDAGGADYAFAVDNTSFDFARYNGSSWVATGDSTVRVCCVGGGTTLMLSVNRSEIANTSKFNFFVGSWNAETRSGDNAPDDGLYNYSLDAGGPDIQGMTVTTSPSGGPRAGKTFVVTPIALKLPPSGAFVSAQPRPESYACRATLAGRTLAGKGAGRCTFRIAKKKTRGKKLIVVVTATYQGATKALPFSFVVS